jgi:hypothetical protein
VTTPAPTTIIPAEVLQGPADIFGGEFGAIEPANAEAVIDGSVWEFLGATDGGATVEIGQTYTPMTVDQVALPVGSRLTEQTGTLATSLAQATLKNLKRALNADTLTGTTFGLKSKISNSEPHYRSYMLKGLSPEGTPRLVFIRRALSTENVALAWTKEDKTMIPVTFSAYYISETVDAIFIDDTPGP